MTRPAIRREQANRDARAAARYYFSEVGGETALNFVAALKAAYDTIADQSALGSSRYGEELGLPGLRHWPLKRFPYLVFYVERGDQIEIWRVLHARSDIGTKMQIELPHQ